MTVTFVSLCFRNKHTFICYFDGKFDSYKILFFFTNYTSNRHTKSYSLLSCWQTGKGITQNRSSKKLIQEYLGEKYIKKRWEEKQQQLLHYQTVICLDPKWSNPPMCAGRTKGRIRTERLKDTNGEPQVPKSCWQKLPLAFWDLFCCVFILLFTSSLLQLCFPLHVQCHGGSPGALKLYFIKP